MIYLLLYAIFGLVFVIVEREFLQMIGLRAYEELEPDVQEQLSESIAINTTYIISFLIWPLLTFLCILAAFSDD